MVQQRRRIKHKISFEEWLAAEAQRFNEAAEKELPGDEPGRPPRPLA
jgi:hypothetical protein